MDRYYELKHRYEKALNARKLKIKKNEDLTLKEKRALIKKIVPKCVNCGKAGGTVFEEKNGMLKAVCASKTPCDLNINLKRKQYENVRDLEIKNDKTIVTVCDGINPIGILDDIKKYYQKYIEDCFKKQNLVINKNKHTDKHKDTHKGKKKTYKKTSYTKKTYKKK